MESREIKYLILDVDGTLTDGRVFLTSDGELFKGFNVKDGLGIAELLPRMNIEPIVITGRNSAIVEKRCSELGISKVFQGVKDKLECIQQLSENYALSPQSLAYMGDDLNDLPSMQYIKACDGLVGCPLDAASDVLMLADFVSTKRGGDGAVREFIEWLANEEREE